MPREAVPIKAQPLLGIVASRVRESVAIYNPQRVLMQLGFDQGTLKITWELDTSSALLSRQEIFGADLLGSEVIRRDAILA